MVRKPLNVDVYWRFTKLTSSLLKFSNVMNQIFDAQFTALSFVRLYSECLDTRTALLSMKHALSEEINVKTCLMAL